MTKFILLRHGQTDWNNQRLYQGQTDIPLNETGKAQAEKAAEEMKDIPFDLAVTSDLSRAKETAQTVLRKHPPVPLIIEPRVRERHFGEFEGTPYQRDLMNPGIQNAIDQNPLTFRFPGGESLTDVSVRAKAVLNDLLQDYPDKTILLVSHGSFLTVFSTLLNNESLENRKKYTFNNAEPYFIN